MLQSKGEQALEYFVRSQKVWFPDFDEILQSEFELYSKYQNNYSSLIAVISYFRKELSRAQFVTHFSKQEMPQKMLIKHRRLYDCAQKLSIAYQNGSISAAEFDEQLLLAFRNRPTEDVFSPVYELWDEITFLISRLEKKSNHLPIYFDGLGWGGYLKGYITRRQYAETHSNFDAGGYLAQVLDYGVDAEKENLKNNYGTEISVCLRLRKLCSDYQAGSILPNEFDSQFLQLAMEFCWDTK